MVIVCLNGFLAFWGSGTYGSPWVNSGTIRYVSLEHFLKMGPVKDSVVIFDEIDQMTSNNSFYLNYEGSTVQACYLPSLLT